MRPTRTLVAFLATACLLIALVPAAAAGPKPSPPACADGRDNDGDGLVDHPADPGCSSESDTDERNEPASSEPPRSSDCYYGAVRPVTTDVATVCVAMEGWWDPDVCVSFGRDTDGTYDACPKTPIIACTGLPFLQPRCTVTWD